MTDSTSHSHQSKESELSVQVFCIENNISHQVNYIIFIIMNNVNNKILVMRNNIKFINTKTIYIFMYLYSYKC